MSRRIPAPGRSCGVRRVRDVLRARGQLDFDDLVVGALARLEPTRTSSPAGAAACRICSSTRCRTSTAPSCVSRSCWPHRRTGSSSSATTTSRSTAGGSPTSGGCSGWPRLPRAAPGRPRDQLPVPAPGRRARRPAGRAQPRAVREADPGPGRRPRAGWSWRPTAATTRSARRVMRSWPDDGSTRRSSPARIASSSRRRGRARARRGRSARRGSRCRSRIPGSTGCWPRPRIRPAGRPLLVALGVVRDRVARAGVGGPRAGDRAAGVGGAATAGFDAFRDAVLDGRRRLADLRRDDAPLTLSTAHGTKGLEFDQVAVIGLDEGRFPSARAVAEPPSPGRAASRRSARLAYVAWTRARGLLLLVYDPGARRREPSRGRARSGRRRRPACSRRLALADGRATSASLPAARPRRRSGAPRRCARARRAATRARADPGVPSSVRAIGRNSPPGVECRSAPDRGETPRIPARCRVSARTVDRSPVSGRSHLERSVRIESFGP